MARALVTGATGFIGSHLARALRDHGDHVTCLVRPSSDRSALEPLGVEFAEGDVLRAEGLGGAVAGADVVYHLAALLKQPWHADFASTNADGVRNVAAACAAAERPPVLVVVSSLAAAGPSPGGRPRTESDPVAPVSLYGTSKLGGERAAAEHAGAVPTTVVRPPMVFGEEDRGALPLFQAAARGLCAVPSQNPPVSMIHVADLARALIAAAGSGERLPASGGADGTGVYYVAAGEHPSLDEASRIIATSLGRARVRTIPLPAPALHVLGAAAEVAARARRRPLLFHRDKVREALAGAWTCSAAKARYQLAFEPAAPLADRLRQTARWYRERGWI